MVFYIVRRCFDASHGEPTEASAYSGLSTPPTHIRRSAEEPITLDLQTTHLVKHSYFTPYTKCLTDVLLRLALISFPLPSEASIMCMRFSSAS
jgi:hypothetical protein